MTPDPSDFSPGPGNNLCQRTLDHGVGALAWVAENGGILGANTPLCRWLGRSQEALQVLSIQTILPQLSAEQWQQLWQDAERGPQSRRVTLRLDQLVTPVEVVVQRLPGEPAVAALTLRDIQAQQQTEDIQPLQFRVLEAVAAGRPLRAVVDLMCRRVEALAPEVLCTVLLIDGWPCPSLCSAQHAPDI